jgi:hypothetical protein
MRKHDNVANNGTSPARRELVRVNTADVSARLTQADELDAWPSYAARFRQVAAIDAEARRALSRGR